MQVRLWWMLILVVVAGCAVREATTQNADEYRAALAAARSEISLPEGADWPVREVNDDDSYEIGLARVNVEGDALCEWMRHWLEVRDSDPAEAERAWEFISSVPDMLLYETTDARGRERYDRLIEQAELGDPSGIARHVELNCQ